MNEIHLFKDFHSYSGVCCIRIKRLASFGNKEWLTSGMSQCVQRLLQMSPCSWHLFFHSPWNNFILIGCFKHFRAKSKHRFSRRSRSSPEQHHSSHCCHREFSFNRSSEFVADICFSLQLLLDSVVAKSSCALENTMYLHLTSFNCTWFSVDQFVMLLRWSWEG